MVRQRGQQSCHLQALIKEKIVVLSIPTSWKIISSKLVIRYCKQKMPVSMHQLLKHSVVELWILPNLFIPQMSTDGVVNHILKLKNKTYCGFGGISQKIWKLSTPCIVESLSYLYNKRLDKCFFPNPFKHAKLIPLHKEGNLDVVNNFRPISLLSAISDAHMESYMGEK